MGFEIKLDTDSVRVAMRDIQDGVPRVIARALNNAMGETRTFVKRGIAADLGIPVGEVDRAIAQEKATWTNLVARLRVTGRRLPLTAFKARQTRRGVTYALTGGRSIADRAFIATMASGHTGVWRRVNVAGPSKRATLGPAQAEVLAGRLPIRELMGPSIPRVLAKQWVSQGWQQRGVEVLQKHVDHEVEYVLQKAGKGGVTAA